MSQKIDGAVKIFRFRVVAQGCVLAGSTAAPDCAQSAPKAVVEVWLLYLKSSMCTGPSV